MPWMALQTMNQTRIVCSLLLVSDDIKIVLSCPSQPLWPALRHRIVGKHRYNDGGVINAGSEGVLGRSRRPIHILMFSRGAR